jgi:hypothetical protein
MNFMSLQSMAKNRIQHGPNNIRGREINNLNYVRFVWKYIKIIFLFFEAKKSFFSKDFLHRKNKRCPNLFFVFFLKDISY